MKTQLQAKTWKKYLTLLSISIGLVIIAGSLGHIGPWWGVGEGVIAAIVTNYLFPVGAK